MNVERGEKIIILSSERSGASDYANCSARARAAAEKLPLCAQSGTEWSEQRAAAKPPIVQREHAP